jgi:hypothetical protein
MTSTVTPLFPADWVDAIFARLTLAWGERFFAQYGALEPAHVKAAWRRELQGITSRGIAYALGHLPGDYPVNAMQFRALCLRAPGLTEPVREQLDGPAPTAASVERLQRALAGLRAPKDDPKAWARALRDREQRGERLGRAQRDAWRAALPPNRSSEGSDEPSKDAGYSPIEGSSL